MTHDPNLGEQYQGALDKWRAAIAAVRDAIAATRALGAAAWLALGALATNTQELLGVGLSDLAELVGMAGGN
ncbi:MAG: hypothetical protein Tsb0020_53620 [Haliangiales bacterium]